MILLIDNYDSFTYNLVQYLRQLGEEVTVRRNDRVSVDEMEDMRPDALVLSPGPRTPREAGVTVEAVRRFYRHIPIMGVCLGHQAIGCAFGGKVVQAGRIMHGKTSTVQSDGRTIFSGMPGTFTAGRYHSLILERSSLPPCLEITAVTDAGEVMGLRHREFPTEGVQFHPESILTPLGKKIIKNFISLFLRKGENAKQAQEECR